MPGIPEPLIGDSPTQDWRLNELTWRRAVALAKGQKMTRRSVVQLGRAAVEAEADPSRQHVADALDASHLIPWSEMVEAGWWPDAGQQDDAVQLLAAWTTANYGIEDE